MRPTSSSTSSDGSWSGSAKPAAGSPTRASTREFATLAELSGGAYPGAAHAAAALEVALGFDQLEELDVVVRDLERGLIDFPSLLGGEEVYLCWLLGEPSVGHWHAVEGGFAGRRPLD